MSEDKNSGMGLKIIEDPTLKEKKRARDVRKQNKKDERREEKQAESYRQGKTNSREVKYDERSIWNKMLAEKHYNQFKEMGDTEDAISSFQKSRVLVSVVALFFGVIAGFLVHPAGVGIGFAGAIILYIMKGRGVDAFYKNWKFERQLAFSKFTRLVIPYLKSSDGNMALYTIFNRVVRRMEDEEDRRNLYRLMGEMGDDPTNIQPFIDFADRSSGTDMSHLFMTTIFDFQQSSFDVTVIDELGKLASEDMMKSVDDIIDFKLQRFAMFPTKIVMASFLLVAGLAAGIMIHSVMGLGFGDMSIDIDSIEEEGTPLEVEYDNSDDNEYDNDDKDDDSIKVEDPGNSVLYEGDRYYF